MGEVVDEHSAKRANSHQYLLTDRELAEAAEDDAAVKPYAGVGNSRSVIECDENKGNVGGSRGKERVCGFLASQPAMIKRDFGTHQIVSVTPTGTGKLEG